MTPVPENIPRLKARWLHYLGRIGFLIHGWKFQGEWPNEKKVILAVAPHTSNLDFLLAVTVVLLLRIKATLFMKKEAFFWPAGGLFRWLGFMPIDRRAAGGVVGSTVRLFEQSEQLWVVIMPEGTRRKVDNWKVGYLRIAREANVPIMLMGLDYATKTMHIGKMISVSDDSDNDMLEVKRYLTQFTGRCPENQSDRVL